MISQKNIILTLILICASIVIINCNQDTNNDNQDSYVPAGEWRTATPERAGMDSGILAQMYQDIEKKDLNIHSVMIIRNGYKISESYVYPYKDEQYHCLNSCTKSVTSLLMGIAIDKGYIKSVDEKIVTIFKDRNIKNIDKWKKKLTIEHLLTMRSGTEWDEFKSNSFDKMIASKDWAQYYLDQKMIGKPGTQFVYDTGASQILAAIIEKKTGMSLAAFADKYLFGPLGITDYYWAANPQGTNIGGTALFMHTRDMAKIGYLVLQNGMWGKQRIVSAKWLKASTITSKTPVTSQSSIPYGYHWRFLHDNSIAAIGGGGQRIFIDKARNMVVVFTAISNNETIIDDVFKTLYINKAVISDTAVAENPEKNESHRGAIKRLSDGPPVQKTRQSPLLNTLIGKTITFEPNDLNIDSISYTKAENSQLSCLEVVGGKEYRYEIGMDNRCRFSTYKYEWYDNQKFIRAIKGYWRNDKTLKVYHEGLAGEEKYIVTTVFNGPDVIMHVERSGYTKISGTLTD